jgi:hypothetical protein
LWRRVPRGAGGGSIAGHLADSSALIWRIARRRRRRRLAGRVLAACCRRPSGPAIVLLTGGPYAACALCTGAEDLSVFAIFVDDANAGARLNVHSRFMAPGRSSGLRALSSWRLAWEPCVSVCRPRRWSPSPCPLNSCLLSTCSSETCDPALRSSPVALTNAAQVAGCRQDSGSIPALCGDAYIGGTSVAMRAGGPRLSDARDMQAVHDRQL